jgi:hypothetical protein
VLLYDEHTWGAFLSGSDPDSMLQKDQWSVKAHMAHQAEEWNKRLLTQAASKISLMWNNNSREIVVYNPYSFPSGGMVQVEFAKNESIYSFEGREEEWEQVSESGTQIVAGLWVEELKPFSYRRYVLGARKSCDRGGKLNTKTTGNTASLENEWYSAVIDTRTGCIISLYDKELNRELCSGNSLGQVIYSEGGEGTTLLGNKPGLSHDGASLKPCFRPEKATRKTSAAGISVILEGPAELGWLKVTYTLYKREKSLNMEYIYDKNETARPEAVYIDFPFALHENSSVLSDSQTGWVDWHKDVMPGACREWLSESTDEFSCRANGKLI